MATGCRGAGMSDGPVRVHVCGRLAVECGRTVVHEADLPARQGRRLWAYLVIHRLRRVSLDDLAMALWGDDGLCPLAWWGSRLNLGVSRRWWIR